MIAAHIGSTGRYEGQRSSERLAKMMPGYANLYSDISVAHSTEQAPFHARSTLDAGIYRQVDLWFGLSVDQHGPGFAVVLRVPSFPPTPLVNRERR